MSQEMILKNEELTIHIHSFGAELSAITDNKTGMEYLWNADEKYWKRHSPILFPIVGSLKNKELHIDGNNYSMSQHGFARDNEFSIIEQKDSEIWFQLKANEETLVSYPYQFSLQIGYRLEKRKISVMWRVKNEDQTKMYFQIGAHPAFLCPFGSGENKGEYKIDFHTNEELHYTLLSSEGLMEREKYCLKTSNGVLPLTTELFEKDALILENSSLKSISLLKDTNEPYVTVNFDAPVVGIWSPANKNAPFVCIEPWYGRCDASDFNGSIEEREWIYSVEAHDVFEAKYEIEIG